MEVLSEALRLDGWESVDTAKDLSRVPRVGPQTVMSDKAAIVVLDSLPPATTVEAAVEDTIELGQWYWVKRDTTYEDDEDWLGCVIHVGSNYVELTSVQDHQMRSTPETRDDSEL